MSVAALVVYGIILATTGMAINRLHDVRKLAPWIWVLLLVSTAWPTFVAYKTFNPGEPVAVTRVARIHEKVSLTVPPDHDLLVRADLTDLTGLSKEKMAEVGKLNYRLSLRGQGWTTEATGEVRRKTGGAVRDASSEGRSAVKDSRSRGAATGEDTETRFQLDGSGPTEVEVALWQGAAADGLVLEVVPQVAPAVVFWGAVGVSIALGLLAEVWFRATQLAGDVAFLTALAVFLPEQVTPDSSFQEAGYAAFGAALVGWLAVGGLAWLLMKWQTRGEEKPAKG